MKLKKLKLIFFLLIIALSYYKTLDLLNQINLNINNESFYHNLIYSSSIKTNDVITYSEFKKIINFKPNHLVNNNFIYELKEEKEDNEEIKVENVNKEETKKPIVYIYNTHQTEKFKSDYLSEYTITPNITIASYMLKENLEEYGIYSYVEENSVKDILNKNKWSYSKSYTVTKSFMEERKKEIPTLKYYIDLHRDSVKKKYTTTTIEGINYAKVMLLVGLDNPNYKENLEEAQKLNKMINEMYPTLSRGIYKKSGKGVNGVYNQDFSNYVFLFEIGGMENNISEVNNTMTALTEVLIKYITNKGDV